jgi:hypothetical protein
VQEATSMTTLPAGFLNYPSKVVLAGPNKAQRVTLLDHVAYHTMVATWEEHYTIAGDDFEGLLKTNYEMK